MMMTLSLSFSWVCVPLVGELPEESDQFRFFQGPRLTHLKGSVGLILVKSSGMRVTVPIDLYTCPFIPLPRFFNSRRTPPLLTPSLVVFTEQSAWAAHGVRWFWNIYHFMLTVHHRTRDIFPPHVYYESIKRKLQIKCIYQYRGLL